MVLKPGEIVGGRYEILEKIGEGGMSIVYKGKDNKLNRFVTVKVLREEYISNKDFRNKFQVEATAVASLSHPNISNVYDVGQEQNINYICMEYIDGLTLKELITKKQHFRNAETLGVALQIANALEHAHSQGIIHRDIKPQNVMVTPTGTVKVMDFGIAYSKYARKHSGDDDTETTMGSVHYISPEHAKNAGIDERSDLYSLGILMYEMATGTLPFDGESVEDILYMHVNEDLPDMMEMNPGISEKLRQIIVKLTQKKPLRRYQNAAELSRDISVALQDADMDMELLAEQGSSARAIFASSNVEDEDIGEDDPEEMIDYGRKSSRRSNKPVKNKTEIAVVAGAVVLALVLAVSVFAFVLPKLLNIGSNNTNNLVQVPYFVGMTLEDAEEQAMSLGINISVKDERYDSEYDEGVVILQNYNEGANVERDTVVEVAVSLGPNETTVPDLRGLTPAQAIAKCDGSFLVEEGAYEYSDTVERNTIISQTPKQGTTAEAGSEITVVISKGPEVEITEKIKVPSVIGMTEAQARAELEAVGLKAGNVTTASSSTYRAGVVIDQIIAEGREVYEGTSVNLVVSSGEPESEEPTPTESTTPSVAPSATPTPTATESPAATESTSASATPSETATESEAETEGVTATASPTSTPTPTPTPTDTTGEEPLETQEPAVSSSTLTLDANVGEDEESVRIELYEKTSNGNVLVYSNSHSPDELPVTVTVNGSGQVTYDLYVNGTFTGTRTVNFGE